MSSFRNNLGPDDVQNRDMPEGVPSLFSSFSYKSRMKSLTTSTTIKARQRLSLANEASLSQKSEVSGNSVLFDQDRAP